MDAIQEKVNKVILQTLDQNCGLSLQLVLEKGTKEIAETAIEEFTTELSESLEEKEQLIKKLQEHFVH